MTPTLLLPGCITQLVLVVFVVLMGAPVGVTSQRTSGPSADPSELDCTATTFPCLRTRYMDLILDFARLEDFDTMSSYPTATPRQRPRSLYESTTQDQSNLPFLRSLCFRPVATFSSSRSRAGDGRDAAAMDVQDPGMLASVQSFRAYQDYFSSQYVLPVLSGLYPEPSTAVPIPTPGPDAPTPTDSPPTGSPTTDAPTPTPTSNTTSNETANSTAAAAVLESITADSMPPPAVVAQRRVEFEVLNETENATTTTTTTTAPPPANTTVSPVGTASPVATTAPGASIVAGDPVKQPICHVVTLPTSMLGTTRSFPSNVTIAESAAGVLSAADLVAMPGVRLLPFHTSGNVVAPFAGSPGHTTPPSSRRQYIVTLAVTTTGARAKALFQLLQSFAVNQGAAATNDNVLYRTCGLFDVVWVTTTDYEAIYLNKNDASRVALFAPVGFGQAASEGLTLPWIILLVVGTCLAAVVLYALCIRRQADANRKDGEKDAGGGGGDGDDDERSNEDDDDYDEELQANEAEQLIQHNLKTVWQEKDLKAELRSAVHGKLRDEEAQAAADQARMKGVRKGNAGVGGGDDGGAAPRGAIATRTTEDGVKLIVLQPLHDTYQGSTQHVRQLRAAGRSSVARVQLLPTTSFFEEALEMSTDYNIPPDDRVLKDEKALADYLRAKHEERRQRDDVLGVGLDHTSMVGLPGADVKRSGGVARGASLDGGAVGDERFGDIMNLPPATSSDALDAVDEALAMSRDRVADAEELKRQEAAEERKSKPMGLAARRMANMMSHSMKFAAVPSGVLRLPSRHEINAQLSGGSAASHMAMAGAPDETAERILRQRFSKLYFAPQALVDQPGYDSDDSAGEASPSSSPRARSVPELRYQEIARNLNPGISPGSPQGSHPHQGSPGPSPPRLPLQDASSGRGGSGMGVPSPTTHSSTPRTGGRSPSTAFPVEL